ncbi:ArsR/SmtB family transcription factor [Cellulomonas sp. P5_C5]
MGRDFSVIGRALAAPARSTFVDLLMDGSRRPAGELAAAAGVSAATASEHLSVLVDAGLVRCDPRGRQRFYSLADDSVAAALERLGHLCPPTPVASYRRSRDARDLARARLCYDHLAGRLGVELLESMQRSAWLTPQLTPTGRAALADLGIPVDDLEARTRPTVRTCPDWTERRPHLAGGLGAAVATLVTERGWVRRRHRGRGLDVTREGADALLRVWGLSTPSWT